MSTDARLWWLISAPAACYLVEESKGVGARLLYLMYR